LLRQRLLLFIIPIAIFMLVIFVPVVYRSEYDRCQGNALSDSVLPPADRELQGCTHVAIYQSLSYQYIGFGGIIYYPINYVIDNCMCFGIREP